MSVDLNNFEALYRNHYKSVRATVLGFRFSEGVIDDLIQETFISAWKNLGSLKEEAAFGGWIKMIARNTCLQELRKRKNTVSISPTDDLTDVDTGVNEVVLVADDQMASFHWEQSVEICRTVIENHNSEPRASIARLFYLEEKPVKDICEVTKLNQNTVLSHLRRFRLLVSESVLQLIEEAGLEIEGCT